MFPFWEVAIAPIFDAVRPRRVVEIGALRGENTVQLLERLGPEADLHVIDPDPQFDPSEHERDFPGRYHFHRALSLDVLGDLPPMDVALVDGDHNWYTVYNELRALAAVAAGAGELLPVLILHDVCWPYGRRDLYYAPETIPAEHRQPYAQRGIRRGVSELSPGPGGLNPTMYNATHEGGPRNGVMTGLDDFVAEHPEPLRVLVLPIYFGLAIAVEQRRLEAQPELAAVLDHLEATAGKDELLDLAEDTRLEAMLFQHNVFFHREQQLEAANRRYLDLLKTSLVGDDGIENELRIDYLLSCFQSGRPPIAGTFAEPARWMREKYRRLDEVHRHGRLTDPATRTGAFFPPTTMGRVRLDHLEGLLDVVRTAAVPGDLVTCGVGRGGSAAFLRGYVEAWDLPWRRVWAADPFRGAVGPDETVSDPEVLGAMGSADAGDLNTARDAMSRLGLLDGRTLFLQGPMAETLPDAQIAQIALLHIGGDQGPAAGEVLEHLWDRLAEGGVVQVDDYGTPACQEAVDAFRARHGIDAPLERTEWLGASWTKGAPAAPDAGEDLRDEAAPGEAAPAGAAPAGAAPDEADGAAAEAAGERVEVPARAPLVAPFVLKPVDLTVVVVFYNMRREARRTLHSLSRAYQEGVEDLDYEVIVVENGSDPDQRLGGKLVRSYGPEFRYLDMGDEARPSPVHALNRGIAKGRGRSFALMIDGAHVLSPGVLHHGMVGLRTYEPAVVSTQQWYVGPGQQGEAIHEGYDQAMEDRLFEAIGWPGDGYRLFDISHFISERDWLDGMWESNCLFVPRSVLSQVGAFDESFDMPGGGYANLDLYERVGSTPGVTVTTMLGEGSFHQVHGGTTTNQGVDDRATRISGYAEHYAEVRGRPFRGHQKPIHYVGRLLPHTVRTRARWRAAPNLYGQLPGRDPDGVPTEATPIPDELRQQFLGAFWNSLRWRRTTWLGKRVTRPPTDLFAYQELIVRRRPDWIVELGTNGGGRALFLASICDLIGHGQVLSVDHLAYEDLPEHDRIRYLTAEWLDPATVEQVRSIVGEDPNALLILGTRRHANNMVDEFDAWSPLVPKGSYVVVEDTIVNGNPVWAAFGPGPHEAVKRILVAHPEFVSDTNVEKWGVSFNPGGFLRRVAR